jgi:carbonic anhydrase/acetyltransferase-like protein (isoleucine patch superfamily)
MSAHKAAATSSISDNRRRLFSILLVLYLSVIWGASLGAPWLLILLAPSHVTRIIAALVSPGIFVLALVAIAGSLSRITLRAIVSGRFARDLGHVIYGPRRLYGICWTSLYYCPAVYHAILAIPALRRLTFRLFGYAGDLNFTCYPDTWIRDLPLLDIGAGAYLGNRATLGSNICLRTGDIVISGIRIGARAMIGHMAVIGLGDHIGDDAEIGVATTLGMNVTVGARTKIGARCGLDHGTCVGADCVVESACVLGRKVIVAEGVTVKFGSIIPAKSIIGTQSAADSYAPPGANRRLNERERAIRAASPTGREDFTSRGVSRSPASFCAENAYRMRESREL